MNYIQSRIKELHNLIKAFHGIRLNCKVLLPIFAVKEKAVRLKVSRLSKRSVRESF